MKYIHHFTHTRTISIRLMLKSARINAAVCILTALLASLSARAASLPGRWQAHPSFYQQIEKIIDGETKTYFMLHQQAFAPSFEDHKINTATLFVYDKENPEAGIMPLSSKYDGLPESFRAATYSPSRRHLAAVAERGTIWIIPDDAYPFAIHGLENINLPGKPAVRSITENPADGKLWLAASYGYAIINPATHSLEKMVRTDFPVDWLCPIGGSLVIFANSSAYANPVASLPSKLSSLQPLTADSEVADYMYSDGKLVEPASLMPLTDNTFAFFAPAASSANLRTITSATRNGDKWRILPIVESEIRMLTKDHTVTSRTANNAYPNKKGYYLHAQNFGIQLLAGVDPDLSAANPADDYKQKIYSSVFKTDNTWRESASWDYSNYWFFVERKGFYRRSFDGSSWKSVSDTIWPDAPAPFRAPFMKWHPMHGLLVSEHPVSQNFQQSSPNIPWLVSALKDGRWKQLSPVFFPPKEIAGNENLYKIFNSKADSYPLVHPDGLAIDPANPQYAYAGSVTTGWARINLDDPSELPLHVGNEKTSTAQLPGFINGYPAFSAWTSLCNFSAPEFDSEGRMWTAYQDYDECAANAYSMALCFYTADELREMANANTDAGCYRDMHRITVKINENAGQNQALLPLCAPANRNLIAFHNGSYESPVYILDHNGTPDDPSDDRLATLDKLFDAATGKVIDKIYPVTLWEDPVTADLWAGCHAGTFRLNPREAFDNPKLAVRHTVKSGDSEMNEIQILESAQANAFATDSDNRLWIATHDEGVICLSPDRETLLGELREAGSALPSDRVYGLCHNPERGSIMISTALGLTEFFPEFLGGSHMQGATVTPSDITPGFRGWVTISGLPAGRELIVTDNSGKTIRALGKANAGRIQWDGENASGQRPATGVYHIRDAETNDSLATFHILN